MPPVASIPVEPPVGDPVPGPGAAPHEMWTALGSDWVAERRQSRTASRSAVVHLHGWLSGPMQFAYYRWLTAPLRSHADVWMPRLPEHGERTRRGARSGELCLSADLELTGAQITRAVAETRWLLRWLRARCERVVLWGVSLGGWVAAMASDPELVDALVLWEPVMEPERTLEDSLLGSVIARHVDGEALEAMWSRAGPALRPAAGFASRAASNTLIVGGRFDDVSPAPTLERVAAEARAELRILPHGHITLLASPRARRLTLAFAAEALRGGSD